MSVNQSQEIGITFVQLIESRIRIVYYLVDVVGIGTDGRTDRINNGGSCIPYHDG